ncbi:hypothetical protein HOF92_13285, partial [bacterium]|nr:hypothetical protein [bacterium]
MVEDHARLAIALAGDPSMKGVAVGKFQTLANELKATTLSAILTSSDQFPLLTLTARLISFPSQFADRMQANADASSALAAILGQSAKTLAEARSLDSQVTLVNNSRQKDILKAIATLEAENKKLQKVLTIAEDPDEIVRRMAEFISNGGDPGQVNEISDLLEDTFPDDSFLDYAQLIVEIKDQVFDPTQIITDMITSSSDPLIGLKVFAEATNLLTQDQLETILNTKEIKDQFALGRNILAIAGKDDVIITGHSPYNLALDGSRSFDPAGDANLRYSWQEIDKIRGDVLNDIVIDSNSAQTTALVTVSPGFRTFRLTVSNVDGSRVAEDEVRFEFYPDPVPVVQIQDEYQTYALGEMASIIATASFYPDGGGISNFGYEQIEGTAVTLQESGGVFTFTAPAEGLYHFKISATKVMPHITVTGYADAFVQVYQKFSPVVDAGAETIVEVGEEYTLTHSTYHPNGANLSYSWSPDVYLSSASDREPVFTPEEPGTYVFTLNVEESSPQVDTEIAVDNGSDTVTIVVVERYAPVAVLPESAVIDFREIAEDTVTVELDGCNSYSIEADTLSYSWSSSTYTSAIIDSSSCNASIVLTKEQYQHHATHHFKLSVSESGLSGEGILSVRIIPANPENPKIFLDYFPGQTYYYAGSEIDIEAWRSFSYNNRDLLFSWVALDGDSRAVSNPFRSRFQGFQRDSLEISVPAQLFDSTATANLSYHYRLIATEKLADGSLGLSSSENVRIDVYQVCPDAPFVADLVPSHTWFRKGASNSLYFIDTSFRALCKNSDGSSHALTSSWSFDENIFTETASSTHDSFVVSMDLTDEALSIGTKEFTFEVRDLVNGQTVTKKIDLDIFDEIGCDLTFEFPGKTSEDGFIQLLPDIDHTLIGSINCQDSDDATDYEVTESMVRVIREEVDSQKQVLSTTTLLYFEDTGSTAPSFDIKPKVSFTGPKFWKLTIEKDHLDEFEEGKLVQKLTPIYVDADYLKLEMDAQIISLADTNGFNLSVNSTSYEDETTALQSDFVLSARGTNNPNQTPAPISFLWTLKDDGSQDDITILNPTDALATARVSGMDPFETNIYAIELFATSSQTGTQVTTVSITVEQDNVPPIITNVEISGDNIYNNVSLTFDLIDFEGESSTVVMEYATGETDWQTSANVFLNDQTLEGQQVAPVSFQGLIWKAQDDLAAGIYEGMQVRLTPTDVYGREGAQGISKEVKLFIPQVPEVSGIIEDRNCKDDGNNLILVNDSQYSGGCVTDVVEFHLLGETKDHPYQDSFRFEWSSNLAIPGLTLPGVDTSYQFIEEQSDGASRWVLGEEGFDPRMNLSSISYKGKIYEWGGTVEAASEVFNTMQVYTALEDSWEQGASGGTGRRQHSAVLYDEKIYQYGGRYKAFEGTLDPPTELSNTFDVYDITKDSWATIDETSGLQVGLLHPLGVVHNDKLYHFSGWASTARGSLDDVHYMNNMYVYDFSAGTWEELATSGAPTIDQLDPRTANYLKGKILYTGFQESGQYRRVWVYDISTNTWSRGTPSTNIPWTTNLAVGSPTAFRAKVPSRSHQSLPSSVRELWNYGTGQEGPYAIAPALSPGEDAIWIAGKKLSKLTTDTGEVICQLSSEENNSGFESPAVAPDGTVYVTLNDKVLYAVDDDCRVKWTTDRHSSFKYARRPAIAANENGYTTAIYVPSGNELIALNSNGQELWRFQTGGEVGISTSSFNLFGGKHSKDKDEDKKKKEKKG